MSVLTKNNFNILVVTVLAFLGFASYLNTFDAAFLFDDLIRIVSNSNIHMERFSWDRLMNAVNPEYPFNRPLAYMSFALNYWLGGLDTTGYHLVNIIIHILSGIGLYLLIEKTLELGSVGKDLRDKSHDVRLIAFLSVIFWLISPVQTQAVTYIVQRMTSMAAMFYIFSLLFYVTGRQGKGIGLIIRLSISFILFIMAVLTKQNSLTLPCVLVLYEICFFRHKYLSSGRERRVFPVIIIIVFLSGALLFYTAGMEVEPFLKGGYALQERIYTEGRVIFFYILLMLLPIPSKMTFFHDFSFSRGLLSPLTTLPSLIFIIAITLVSLYRIRRDPVLSFFMLWFIILILPESMFLHIFPVFEHRLYLPSVGFYVFVAVLLFRMLALLKGKGELVFYIALVLIPLLFSINTYARNSDWHDSISMWSDNVKKSPMIPRPHDGLAVAYLLDGKLDRAEEEFKISKSLDPLSSAAALGLGIIYYKRGNPERAFREFEYIAGRMDLGVQERYYDADKILYKMGEDILKTGKVRDAVRVFKLGLKFNPENDKIINALNNLEGRK